MLLINFYVRLGAMFWVVRSARARTVEKNGPTPQSVHDKSSENLPSGYD